MRLRMAARPDVRHQGEPACAIPNALVARRDELALTVGLICHRQLFGMCYLGLQPDYFYGMPQDSGVLVRPIVPTRRLAPKATHPGDIDLLVIPYEGDELVLDRVITIEVKAIRATYLRQGRSPNEYGFSQASSLRALGFPYVALAHLIVSDESPEEAWREISAATVIGPEGRISELFPVRADMMPADLIRRAYGRLEHNCTDFGLGLVAAYIGADVFKPADRRLSTWTPDTRAAVKNAKRNDALLGAVGAFYLSDPEMFVAIPRHDPIR